MAEELAAGLCKWFNVDKGYGFICPEGGGPDVFVHKKHLLSAGINRPLQNEEPVKFASKQSDKGMVVTSIQLISA